MVRLTHRTNAERGDEVCFAMNFCMKRRAGVWRFRDTQKLSTFYAEQSYSPRSVASPPCSHILSWGAKSHQSTISNF